MNSEHSEHVVNDFARHHWFLTQSQNSNCWQGKFSVEMYQRDRFDTKAPHQDVSEGWIQHQIWKCIYCLNRRVFASDQDLKTHAEVDHRKQPPTEDVELVAFLDDSAEISLAKRYVLLA